MLTTDTELINQWRDETPGCKHRIHLNNAGASLMPQLVINAVSNHLENEIKYGGYEAADAISDQISEVYEAISKLIGTKASNIAIVENATVAVSQALSAFDFQQGDTVITTNVDYSSYQIMLLNLVKRFGIEVIRAKDLTEGGVDPESVRRLVKEHDPRLVMAAWVPTNSGLVQDVQAIGKICAEADVSYIVDACQAVGQLPVNVNDLHCDFLAATSRKFLRGPRGLGFLYVSDRMLEQDIQPLYLDTRGAKWTDTDHFRPAAGARRFENWEFPYALVLGMGAAADYALDIGIETAGQRASALAEYCRKQLSQFKKVRVLDRGKEQSAIVTVAIEGVAVGTLVAELRGKGINTSGSSRHHSVIDMDEKEVKTALRISPHYYNTKQEIDVAMNAIRDTLQ